MWSLWLQSLVIFLHNYVCLSWKIVIDKKYIKIKKFNAYVNEHSKITCDLVKKDISSLDNISSSGDIKSYENGCEFLLRWLNSLK